MQAASHILPSSIGNVLQSAQRVSANAEILYNSKLIFKKLTCISFIKRSRLSVITLLVSVLVP